MARVPRYMIDPTHLSADDRARRASLRRQVALLDHIRERMRREPEADYARWAGALMDLTDDLHHELMALEGVPPYPHPRRRRWWEQDAPPGALARMASDDDPVEART